MMARLFAKEQMQIQATLLPIVEDELAKKHVCLARSWVMDSLRKEAQAIGIER